MKPLENRTWFALGSLAVSAVLMLGLWLTAGLPLNLSAGAVFVFASLGLWQGVNKLLALALIKLKPSLGAVH